MEGRLTVSGVKARKGQGRLVTVTAYDAPTGALLDEAGVDIVLVGDSLGNVVLGHDSTLPVTMRDMVHHLRAVRRGVERALLVADMPFLSYQTGPRDALRNAGRFLKEGADAVKLEGGHEIVDTVRALLEAGIPVMGHVGYTPQRIREYGSPKVVGKSASAAYSIWREARALDRLGVFSMVLESVPVALAERVTAACSCPTIGIGAGPRCDGQVLVFHDLAGLSASPPPFARAYANGREDFLRAVGKFAGEVRDGGFPPAGRPDLEAGDAEELDRMISAAGEK